MREPSIEDGWQRFLDRLRRLWGRLRPGEFAGAAVNMAGSHDRRSLSRRIHGTTAPRTDGGLAGLRSSRTAEQALRQTDHLDVWEDEGGALVRPAITVAPPEH
jgi:hypothetical protein